MFREAVLAFLGVGGPTPQDNYCTACKQLGEDDCSNCTRSIEVVHGG